MKLTMIECLEPVDGEFTKVNLYFSENITTIGYIKSNDLYNYQVKFPGVVVDFNKIPLMSL